MPLRVRPERPADRFAVFELHSLAFPTDAEAFGRDAYLEAGPGQAFLSTAHTMRHFRTANFQPDLPEPGPFETWSEAGSQTLEQRANARWKAILANYEQPPMDKALAEALDAFVDRRKGEMADEWY